MPPAVAVTPRREPDARQRRCPSCGQRFQSTDGERCSLCGYRFTLETATGEDRTPFAAAYAEERSAWWEMVRWIYAAREIRLKHLALLRVSAASRHFARISMLWTGVGLAVFEWTRQGWRWNSPTGASGSVASPRPVGAGWFHVVSAPAGGADALPGAAAELWWNAAEALIALPLALVLGFLLGIMLLALFRSLVAIGHGPALRSEGRMGAAIGYGTAWIIPLLAAAAALGLRPLAYAGGVAHWFWYPPQPVLDGMAGVAAIGGVVLWWFWLFRMAMTAPTAVRSRVVFTTAFVVPTLAAAAGVGWYLGFPQLCGVVFRSLGLQS